MPPGFRSVWDGYVAYFECRDCGLPAGETIEDAFAHCCPESEGDDPFWLERFYMELGGEG